jgi:hypothetical protein
MSQPTASAAFSIVGGSEVSLENMKINGHKPGKRERPPEASADGGA